MTLPLTLKIIIGVLILLVILFFAIKNKRRYIWPLFVIVAGIGVWKGLELYNKKNPDIANVKADVKIPVVDLIKEYEKNDSLSNQKYLGKIIEVDGNIKEIKTDDKGYYTIILGDSSSLSSVRCSMDTTHQKDAAKLAAGSSTIVRGSCTGFNKDEMGLGSDVIMNRCVIVTTKNE